MAKFNQTGKPVQIYLVGGAVRDLMLGMPIKDRDYVVVGATPEQLLAQGYVAVGNDFPVFLHPKTKQEYALARTERKQGQGYTGFACYFAPDVSLEQDLLRRDLTINAMAYDEHSSQLVDPYGGQADLEAKLLRHVSDAFTEDPLRVLRVARFYARFAHLGFHVAPETIQLMHDMAHSGELRTLTAERVWQETARALQEQTPQAYWLLLWRTGALAVIWPELAAVFGAVPARPATDVTDAVPAPHAMLSLAALQACAEQAINASSLGSPTIDSKSPLPATGLACSDPSHPASAASLSVRFALLCRYIGQELPTATALAQLKARCEQLRVTNECRELALLLREHGPALELGNKLPDAHQLTLLERVDVFRKPQRFTHLLYAHSQLLAAQRVSYTASQPPLVQADDALANLAFWHAAASAVMAVDVQTIIAQGFSGAAIKPALQAARLAALTRNNNAH
jgi:tRNA nucleotidyltransferase (CCA-adding enzyme)